MGGEENNGMIRGHALYGDDALPFVFLVLRQKKNSDTTLRLYGILVLV